MLDQTTVNMGSYQGTFLRIYERKLALVTGSARSKSDIGSSDIPYSLSSRYRSRNSPELASKGCDVFINYATEASDASAVVLAANLEKEYSVGALPIRADITSREECA